MTRDELLKEIKDEVEKVLPDGDAKLDGDDFDTVQETITKVIDEATDATDEADEDDDKEEE